MGRALRGRKNCRRNFGVDFGQSREISKTLAKEESLRHGGRVATDDSRLAARLL